MKRAAAIATGLMLAGCATGERPRPAAAPIPFPAAGGTLGNVIGRNADQLSGLFGAPSADVREGTGRKLQFAGAICVLDAYLYPHGAGTPVVTYVDARQTDGSPIDKGSCVAALQKRGR